jgi:protein TonB
MKTNYQNASMLDMIFENRNKAYGAYVLRSEYNKFTLRAILITFSSVFLILAANAIREGIERTAPVANIHETILNLIEPIVQRERQIQPPPKPQSNAANKHTAQNTEMRVTASSEIHDSIPPSQEPEAEPGLANNNAGTDNPMGEAGGKGDGPAPEPVTEFKVAQPQILTTAEIMPEFPGGEKALMKFLQAHTNYPDYERNADIQGKAYIKFVVNEDGSISNAEAVRGDTKGFQHEGLRVVSLLPKFKPGMQGGKTVRVQCVIPFFFQLNN